MSSTLKFEPFNYYHIFNKAVNKNKLFLNNENYRFFLDKLYFYTKDVFEIYSYCLLPNHFHLLVKIKDIESHIISEQLRRFSISYTQSFNIAFHRKGTLFERPFQRKLITDDDYLISSIYYIHSNSEHHHICSDFRNYKWSSYQDIINKKNKFVSLSKVLNLFNDLDYFIEFHKDKRMLNKG
ncbi:MAG: transposase [Candidatus Marinimicrobia bacterium]|nr:transposase [Candidatus Neomarinimicrobiota bacterium]